MHERHRGGASGACRCYVARRVYLAPLRLNGRILKGGDAPPTTIFRHHHRVHGVTFSRLAARAELQVPFGVNNRHVGAQEADALDRTDVMTVLVDGGEYRRVPLLHSLATFRALPHNLKLVSIRGERGGERLPIVCVPAVLNLPDDLPDGGLVRA